MSRTRNYLHIVFGTKYRENTIQMDRRSRLYGYITKIVQNKKSDLLIINGVGDHVHLLIDLHSTVSLSEMVQAVKQSSSKWIRENMVFPMFEGWSSEYYACSVSPSHIGGIRQYISGQELHHGMKDFREEVNDFVTKMGLSLYKDEP